MPYSCTSLLFAHHMCLTFAKSSRRFTAHMMNESAVLNSIRFFHAISQQHGLVLYNVYECCFKCLSVIFYAYVCFILFVLGKKEKRPLFIKACCTLFTVLGVSCLFVYVYAHISYEIMNKEVSYSSLTCKVWSYSNIIFFHFCLDRF